MELWKAIPGAPGYEVSDQGNIRSVERVIVQKSRGGASYERVFPAKTLTPRKGSSGPYLYANPSVNGKAKNLAVHIAVLTAFVGPKPSPKHEGCHKDDNPLNNTLPNLYWGTRKENEADKKANGGAVYGEQNYNAKLSNAVVAAIKSGEVDLNKYGATTRLARALGVRRNVIECIKNGRAWKNINHAEYTGTPEFQQAIALMKSMA